MANDVVVRFLLQGMPEVSRALRTVEQAAARAGRAAPVSSGRPTNASAIALSPDEARRSAVAIAEENRRAQGRLDEMARARGTRGSLVTSPRTRAESKLADDRYGAPARQPLAGRTEKNAKPGEHDPKAKLAAQLRADAEAKAARSSGGEGEKKAQPTAEKKPGLAKAAPQPRRRGVELEGPPEPTMAMKRAALEGPPEPTAAQRKKADSDAAAGAKARLKAELKADADLRKSREKDAKKTLADAEKTAKAQASWATKLSNLLRKEREKENNQILADVAKITRAEEAAERKKEAARKRAADKLAKKEERDDEKFRRGVGHAVGHAITHGVSAGVSRVADKSKETLGMVTQLGGGFSIADSVARAAHNSGQLEDLLNAATNTASESAFNRKRHDAKDVEPQIQGTAMRYGMGREDIQGGLREMVAMSADFETSLKLMPKIAELARAEGASFHSLAEAAGNVVYQFKDIKDSGEKAKAVMEVMRGLGGQGKAGNIDMRQQAKQIGAIIAASSRFDASGKTEGGAKDEDEAERVKGNVQNILKMGALMQFARGGGGAISPATARSAVTAFTAIFGKTARLGKFESELGMGSDKIFADKEQTILRPPEEIIVDAMKASKGNTPKLMAALGSVVGEKSVHTLRDAYVGAEKKEKGSGEAAVRKQFDNMVKETMMHEPEVTSMAGKRMGALDAQMQTMQEKFDVAVQDKIIPALLKLVPVLDKMVPMFVDLNAKALPAFVDLIKTVGEFVSKNQENVNWFASHPIGSLIALEIGKSLATAGIGEAVKGIFLKAAGMLPGGKTPGAPGGAGGGAFAGGAGSVGLGVGLATGAVVGNAMIKYEVGTERAEDITAKLEAWRRGERDPARAMSPEQAQKAVNEAKTRLNKGNTLEHTADLLLSPVLDASSKDYAQYKADQGLVDNEALTKALKDFNENKDLITAMDNFAKAARELKNYKPEPSVQVPLAPSTDPLPIVTPPAAFQSPLQRPF